MDQVKIGKFIANCRKKQKFTQEQLAEKLGISNRAVSKWENGICMPDSSIISELCKILNITINDLFSGEEIGMKVYAKKADENILELQRQKEEADIRLLRMEIICGILCLLPLLISVVIVTIVPIEEWVVTLIVLMSLIPLLIVTPFMIRIEQIAGYYECGKCHHKYIPTYKSVFMSAHINRTRYMKCPKCNKKSWNKKVVGK